MLEYNLNRIGEKLYKARKKTGMTQLEIASLAGISDRSYADIERGSTTMRIDTLLKICDVLHITPDELLVADQSTMQNRQDELFEKLSLCDDRRRDTILNILNILLNE